METPTKRRALAGSSDNVPQTPSRSFSASIIQSSHDWSYLPSDLLQHRVSPHLETSLAREVCSRWADSILVPYIYLSPQRAWDDEMREELTEHFVCSRGLKLMGLTSARCSTTFQCLLEYLDSIEGASPIKDLWFFRCALSPPFAKLFASVLHHPRFHLESIRFSDCTVAPEVADALSEALSKETVSLTRVRGAGSGLSVRTIAPLMAQNTSLTYMNLSQSRVQDGAGPKFAESLKQNSTLSYLNLQKSGMSHVGISAFLECLGTNKGLKVLKISKNLSRYEVAPPTAADFDFATTCSLGTNTTLTHLDLSDLSNLSLPNSFYQHFATGIAQNKTLKHLILRSAQCNSPQIKILAPALASHPTLETLDLSHNMMNSDGGKPLMAALEQNSSLRTLKLLQTNASAVFLFNLFNSLVDKPNLTSLSISKGHFDNDVTSAFESLIDSSTPLYHLEFSNLIFKKPKDCEPVIDLITSSSTIKSVTCSGAFVDGYKPPKKTGRSSEYDPHIKLAAFSTISGLKKLNIRCDSDITWFSKECQNNILEQKELEYLHLNDLVYMEEFLINVLRASPIRTLSVFRAYFSSPDGALSDALTEALKCSPTLKVIKLEYGGGVADKLRDLIPQCISFSSVQERRNPAEL